MNPRQHRQRGQSLVEFCFVLPILLVMFAGVYTTGSFISDMDIAGQATRGGARLGAEVANYGYGTAAAQAAACMGASTTNPSWLYPSQPDCRARRHAVDPRHGGQGAPSRARRRITFSAANRLQ